MGLSFYATTATVTVTVSATFTAIIGSDNNNIVNSLRKQ